MKRDFDLIRRILADIEYMPAGKMRSDVQYPGEYDKATVYEHIELLLNEGFMNGKAHKSLRGLDAIHITGLTWKGHDFLDAARDDTIWKKAKETILKPTASITFSLLLDWLKQEAKARLGLP